MAPVSKTSIEVLLNSARRLAPSLMLLLALFGFAPAPAAAVETRTSPEQASKFVEDLGHRFETLLGSNDGHGLGQHRHAFEVLVREGFDLELIGRFVLARSWKAATATQQLEYQRLFALWTINSYGRLLGGNQGGSIAVIGAESIDGRDALVRTKISLLNAKPIEIDLRVRDTDGQMKIVEVLMASASMSVTQRDEFASVIQHRGVDGLIAVLGTRVGSLQAEATQD
jgi:phospholipid transport system substrate-binding protein